MKNASSLINYYISYDGSNSRIFSSTIMFNSEGDARDIISKSLKKNNKQPLSGQPLHHVCLDTSSLRLYSTTNTKNQKNTKQIIDFVANHIKNTLDLDVNKDLIVGNPLTLIRFRKLNEFSSIYKYIKSTAGDDTQTIVDNLPIIEANLERMPNIKSILPPEFFSNGVLVQSYIPNVVVDKVDFFVGLDDEGQDVKPIFLHSQPSPFILVDTSPKNDLFSKENQIRYGIKTLFMEMKIIKNEFEKQNNQDPIESITQDEDKKRTELLEGGYVEDIKDQLMYGWHIETLSCKKLATISNFKSLIDEIKIFMMACDLLVKDGKPNPIQHNYYATFKVDQKKFPLLIDSIKTDGKLDRNKQIKYFFISDYDEKTQNIIISTPIMIPPSVCKKILKASSEPLITQYNPQHNTIDVKTGQETLSNYKGTDVSQLQKIHALTKYSLSQSTGKNLEEIGKIKFRGDDAEHENYSEYSTGNFYVRKISEFYAAEEHIKKMCKLNNVDFVDVDVVIGPIDLIFGKGAAGGFLGVREFQLNKWKSPHRLLPTLEIHIPTILVNSNVEKTPERQSYSLVHEYSHHLFTITNPNHKHDYLERHIDPSTDEFWDSYLDDPDEMQAHKHEIKLALEHGKTPSELIRQKFGIITSNIYPRAKKFEDLINIVIEEMKEEQQKEKQKNENPDGKSNNSGRNNPRIDEN